jgi:hypothetical protein
MCKQTQFPICLLNFTIRRSLFHSQNLVERGWSAFPNPYHGGLLFGGVFAVLISLIVIARPRRAPVGAGVRSGRCCRWHRCRDADRSACCFRLFIRYESKSFPRYDPVARAGGRLSRKGNDKGARQSLDHDRPSSSHRDNRRSQGNGRVVVWALFLSAVLGSRSGEGNDQRGVSERDWG